MKLKRTTYPDKDLTPEHTKRESYDHTSEGDIHPDINAAYDYVDSILDTSDDDDEYAWHGWGIREAFLAGISFARIGYPIITGIDMGSDRGYYSPIISAMINDVKLDPALGQPAVTVDVIAGYITATIQPVTGQPSIRIEAIYDEVARQFHNANESDER